MGDLKRWQARGTRSGAGWAAQHVADKWSGRQGFGHSHGWLCTRMGGIGSMYRTQSLHSACCISYDREAFIQAPGTVLTAAQPSRAMMTTAFIMVIDCLTGGEKDWWGR